MTMLILLKAILAVDRHGLNKHLLDELENMSNVKLLFNHKLVGADFNNNTAWFEDMRKKDPSSPGYATTASGNREIEIKFDFMIGADGAHSAVRYHMMKFTRMDYTQEYIDTLWCEFHIRPDPSNTKHNGFRISPNHLHIWPGGSFMFIAIPSLNKSFTSTLFLPADRLAEVNSDPANRLVPFFQSHFPGVVPDLIPEADLHKQYAENPHLPLISIKCAPYHVGGSAVILGDAAHAMVPFYGQGMNAGLEDVRTLYESLDRFVPSTPASSQETGMEESQYVLVNGSAEERAKQRARALEEYSRFRRPDAHAINDLALRNYQEMRSDVQSPVYRLRKAVEERLSVWLPGLGIATQYSRVSFGNERYSVVDKVVQKQGKVLLAGMTSALVATMGWVGWLAWRMNRVDDSSKSAAIWLGRRIKETGRRFV